MVEEWTVVVPELTGTEERKAYVYLPESYGYGQDRRYPVLYMFDGHNVFFDSHATYGKCWGMKEYMDHTNTQMIIAAVECNHSPDNGRLREYSPFSFFDPKSGKIEGKGKITMDWLVRNFKKEIDVRYRTLPDRANTYIAGSSMGGLMSLYAITEYNKYFRGAAALSPSLWTAPAKLERLFRRAHMAPDTVIYMDYGSKELRGRSSMTAVFGKTVELFIERGAFVESRIVPGGSHCEASWERQIPFFMNTLLYQP